MKTKISDEFDGMKRLLGELCCKHCDRLFWCPVDRISRRKFCSCKCAQEAQRATRIEIECDQCSRSFYRVPSHVERKSKSGLRFCSRHCKEEAQSLEGGNVAALQPKHYGNGIRAAYRRRVLRRRPNRCVRCGYRQDPKMLDVHHIDGDRTNNKPNNLEIVCVWCHALITRCVAAHKWNGRFSSIRSGRAGRLSEIAVLICARCKRRIERSARWERANRKGRAGPFCGRACASSSRRNEKKHGTVTCYSYHKCRCNKCRAAQAMKMRQYNAKKRAVSIRSPP